MLPKRSCITEKTSYHTNSLHGSTYLGYSLYGSTYLPRVFKTLDQRPVSLRDKHLLLTQAMINMITLWLEATQEKSTLQRSESSLSFVPTLYAFKIPLSVSKASTSSVSMTAVKNLQRLEVVFKWMSLGYSNTYWM